MKNIKYYLPGVLLIFMAILILFVPEIIVAFISATVIFLGIGMLYLGHTIRKTEDEYDSVFNDTYFKSPFHRVYYSWFNKNFPGNIK